MGCNPGMGPPLPALRTTEPGVGVQMGQAVGQRQPGQPAPSLPLAGAQGVCPRHERGLGRDKGKERRSKTARKEEEQ